MSTNTAMLGDTCERGWRVCSSATARRAQESLAGWVRNKATNENAMFPALLVTLVTGKKTYLPDGQQVRKRQIDKDGSLEAD